MKKTVILIAALFLLPSCLGKRVALLETQVKTMKMELSQVQVEANLLKLDTKDGRTIAAMQYGVTYYGLLGMQYYNNKDMDNALRCLNKGLPLVRPYARSHVTLGLARIKPGIVYIYGTLFRCVIHINKGNKAKAVEDLLVLHRLGVLKGLRYFWKMPLFKKLEGNAKYDNLVKYYKSLQK